MVLKLFRWMKRKIFGDDTYPQNSNKVVDNKYLPQVFEHQFDNPELKDMVFYTPEGFMYFIYNDLIDEKYVDEINKAVDDLVIYINNGLTPLVFCPREIVNGEFKILIYTLEKLTGKLQ